MLKKLFKFCGKASLWFVVLSVLWVLLYRYVPVKYTPLMAIRAAKGGDNYEHKHEWKSIDVISTHLQLAIICAEDQTFLAHNGFDYEAIKKAYKNNMQGKKLRGASTISQQVAKNVFLWPTRSWFRKGMETYFTFWIETLWSKERILEVYLNSIEMGDGIYGAEAAANYWFNTNATSLTKEQAASIAAILPNPLKHKATPRTLFVEKRTTWITQQMRNFGTLNFEETPVDEP